MPSFLTRAGLFGNISRFEKRSSLSRGRREPGLSQVGAYLDHRDLFLGRPFIDQLSVGSCHSCALAEVYSVVTGQSISPVQHFLDWWSREGADKVLSDNIELVRNPRKRPRGRGESYKLSHGGHALSDFNLLKRYGCSLDPNHQDTFAEVDKLFRKLHAKRRELIRGTPISVEQMEQQLRESGLDRLLTLALADQQIFQRQLVRNVIKDYSIECLEFSGYTDSHFWEMKQALLMFLEEKPLVAQLILTGKMRGGHAIVLVAYDAYDDIFFYKDSASQEGFQKIDAGFLIGRLNDVFRLTRTSTIKSLATAMDVMTDLDWPVPESKNARWV